MRNFTLLLSLVCSVSLFGQVTFQTIYGTPFTEQPNSIETNLNGEYAIAGTTNEHDINGNYLLILTNAFGDTLWSCEYDWGAEYLTDMKCTSDGGYILCGYSADLTSPSTWDVMLIKTDSLGNVQWSRDYGFNGLNNEFPDEIIETTDGGFAVAGRRDSAWQNYEGFILKVNAAGSLQWLKGYELNTNLGYWNCITEAANGDLIIAGFGVPYPGVGVTYVMRVDSAGVQAWCHKFTGPTTYIPQSIVEHGNNRIFICGGSANDSSHAKGFLMRLDQYGYLLWTKEYDLSSLPCSFTRMIVTTSGQLALIGRQNYPIYDGFAFVADTSGVPSNAFHYVENSGNSYWYSDITEGADGGFGIVAYVESAFSGIDTASILLIKTTSTLSAQCGINSYTLNPSSPVLTDSLRTPGVQNGNYYYLPGYTVHSGLGVIIACPLVGIDEAEVTTTFVYPNPVSDLLTVNCKSRTEFVLYNVAGEIVVRAMLNEPTGTVSVRELASGVYFYQLIGENEVIHSGKLMKQ